MWLFGGLHTLSDAGDEQGNREKAVKVAEMIEGLAKGVEVGGVKKEGEA